MLKTLEQLHAKVTVVLRDVYHVDQNKKADVIASSCGESSRTENKPQYTISKSVIESDSSVPSLNMKINLKGALQCRKRKSSFDEDEPPKLTKTSEKTNSVSLSQSKSFSKSCLKSKTKEQHKQDANELLPQTPKTGQNKEIIKIKDSLNVKDTTANEKKLKKRKKEKKKRKDRSQSPANDRTTLRIQFQQLVESTLNPSDLNPQIDNGDSCNSEGRQNDPMQQMPVYLSQPTDNSTDDELAAIASTCVGEEPGGMTRSDSVATVELDLDNNELCEVVERIPSPTTTSILTDLNGTQSLAAADASTSELSETLPLESNNPGEQDAKLVGALLSEGIDSTQISLPIDVATAPVSNPEDDQLAQTSTTQSSFQDCVPSASTKEVTGAETSHLGTDFSGTDDVTETSQSPVYKAPATSVVDHCDLNCTNGEELTIEELESREKDLVQQKTVEKENLTECLRKCRPLRKEFLSLHSASMVQKENLESKKELINRKKAETAELFQAVEQHQEERNRSLSSKKDAHEAVLHTTIGLRELQVELCKQQLQLGLISNPDESNPAEQTIRSIEIRVANLKQELSAKSAKLVENETAFADIDSKYNSMMEQSQKLLHELKDTEAEHKELNEVHAASCLEIEALKARLKQSTNELIAHENSTSNLKLEIARIASFKARKRILAHKHSFIERMDQLFSETAQPIDSYLESLNQATEIPEVQVVPTPEEQSSQSSETYSVRTADSAEQPTMNLSGVVSIRDSIVGIIAQRSEGVTQLALENAISFYQQFCDNSAGITANEQRLSRLIVLFSYKYVVFKKNLTRNVYPRTKETLRQLATLLGGFVFPFYHLMILRNMSVSDLCGVIEDNARASNGYDMSTSDTVGLRNTLAETVLYAVNFSIKYKHILSNSSLVDVSPSASTSTLTPHQPMIMSESMASSTTQLDTSGMNANARWTEMGTSPSHSAVQMPTNPSSTSATTPPSVDQGGLVSANHQLSDMRIKRGMYHPAHQTPHSRYQTPSVQPWAHQQYIENPAPQVPYTTNPQQHVQGLYRQQYAHPNFQPTDQNAMMLNSENSNLDAQAHQMPAISSMQASNQLIMQQGCTPLQRRVLPTPAPPLPHNSILVQRLMQQSAIVQHHAPASSHFHCPEAHQQLPQDSNYQCRCGREAHQRCSGCDLTYYCSRACQVVLPP